MDPRTGLNPLRLGTCVSWGFWSEAPVARLHISFAGSTIALTVPERLLAPHCKMLQEGRSKDPVGEPTGGFAPL